MLKLDHIIGASLRTIYAVTMSPEHRADTASRRAVVVELDSALNSWSDAVPDQLRWDPLRADQRLFTQSAILYTQYYYCQILVHRSFIPKPNSTESIGLPSLRQYLHEPFDNALIRKVSMPCESSLCSIGASTLANATLAPILDQIHIPFRPERRNGSLLPDNPPSLYRQDPSKEVDQAWLRLTNINPIPMSAQDVRNIGYDPDIAARWPKEYGLGDDAYSEWFPSPTDVWNSNTKLIMICSCTVRCVPRGKHVFESYSTVQIMIEVRRSPELDDIAAILLNLTKSQVATFNPQSAKEHKLKWNIHIWHACIL